MTQIGKFSFVAHPWGRKRCIPLEAPQWLCTQPSGCPKRVDMPG